MQQPPLLKKPHRKNNFYLSVCLKTPACYQAGVLIFMHLRAGPVTWEWAGFLDRCMANNMFLQEFFIE